MLAATFGEEEIGGDQRSSTDGDVDRGVRFLGLLNLGLFCDLSELALRRLLSGSGGLWTLVQQAADTHLSKTGKGWGKDFANATEDVADGRKDAAKRKPNAVHPVRIAVGRDELIAQRTGWGVVRCTKAVGDVVDVSHGSNGNQRSNPSPHALNPQGHWKSSWICGGIGNGVKPLINAIEDCRTQWSQTDS